MSYPGATIKNNDGITIEQLIDFLEEVGEQEGYDCKLGCPGSGSSKNLKRVKISGHRGVKAFFLWMDEGYDSNDDDYDDGLLIKKKKPAATKATKAAEKVAAKKAAEKVAANLKELLLKHRAKTGMTMEEEVAAIKEAQAKKAAAKLEEIACKRSAKSGKTVEEEIEAELAKRDARNAAARKKRAEKAAEKEAAAATSVTAPAAPDNCNA